MLSDEQIAEIAVKTIERRRNHPLSSRVFEDNMVAQAGAELARRGLCILEVLSESPTRSYRLLASSTRNVTAFGLKRSAFVAFQNDMRTKEFTKDLLVRTIHAKAPAGWPDGLETDLHWLLNNWQSDIAAICLYEAAVAASLNIGRELAFTNPPNVGWLPNGTDDPIVVSLIDKHWHSLQ